MRIYLKQNVWDAALDRMRYIFDEFPNVIVGFSGGKDSTVTMNLALIVAKEKGRLPLKVMFIDQEAEWQSTIDYVEKTFKRPEIEPIWLQCPIKIFNASSHLTDKWLQCWEPGADWIRPKNPISIKDNTFGTDRFADMFEKFLATMYPNQKTAYLAGVRAEESPARFVGLTSTATYKKITYGKILNRKFEHYTVYPLYDWTYMDIWKAIHDNNWDYCKLYDLMWQHGVPVRQMRVSNVHHETAVRSLFYLHEIEADTWEKVSKRLEGVNTMKHLEMDSMKCPNDLPFMFQDWREYRDHLTENLIVDESARAAFKKIFERMDKQYKKMYFKEDMYKVQITALMVNDYHSTKIANWERIPEVDNFRKYLAGQFNHKTLTNRYVSGKK